ncbi:MAG: hypothetical protein ACUVUR_05205 [bacterium]
MINGYLYRGEYYDYTIEYERFVKVVDSRGLRMVPVVSLNNETLDVFYYSWTEYRYGDTEEFNVNLAYQLLVEHYWGKAYARVTMPGNFSLINPPERYILDLDSTLFISWYHSPGAEWYQVELVIDYEYRDSTGDEDDFTFTLDTILTDTFLTVASGRIFPGFVMDVIEGDGSAMVLSGCGPAIEPGDKGNVTGSGFGFFNALNEPREKYFYVGAPIVVRRCPEIPKAKERLLERLRRRAGIGQ